MWNSCAACLDRLLKPWTIWALRNKRLPQFSAHCPDITLHLMKCAFKARLSPSPPLPLQFLHFSLNFRVHYCPHSQQHEFHHDATKYTDYLHLTARGNENAIFLDRTVPCNYWYIETQLQSRVIVIFSGSPPLHCCASFVSSTATSRDVVVLSRGCNTNFGRPTPKIKTPKITLKRNKKGGSVFTEVQSSAGGANQPKMKAQPWCSAVKSDSRRNFIVIAKPVFKHWGRLQWTSEQVTFKSFLFLLYSSDAWHR